MKNVVDFASARGRVTTAGSPPYDGDMETRVAKLEATVEHVQRDVADIKVELRDMRKDIVGIRTTDFRLLFGAIITVALGLAAVMAKGFHWF